MEARTSNEFDAAPSHEAPVLARVPWLAEEEPAALLAEIEPVVVDAAPFCTHRIVASADLGVASYGEATMQWRVDPPQPKSAPDQVEEGVPAEPAPKLMATDEVLRANVAEQAPPLRPTAAPPAPGRRRSSGMEVAPRQTSGSNGVTQWRFDPPEAAGHAFEKRERSPSPWHQRVAAIDNGIRRYHRVIVLAALITAAGLMMLVLEGQRPPVLPAPEVLTPAASDSTSPTDSEPLPMQEASPLVDTSPEAHGPGRAESGLVIASPNGEPLPITPIEPYRESYSTNGEDAPEIGLPYVNTGAPEIAFGTPTIPRAHFSGEIQPVPQQAKNDQHESSLH